MSKRTIFETDWSVSDRVYIDGDQSLKAVICGFRFSTSGQAAMLEWIHDGKAVSADIELFRLSAAE